MSDSVRPHRWQPTRLPRPWDSPGKNTGVGCQNTGVGCRFLLQCMKVKSESEVAQPCPTLSDPTDRSLPGSSSHGIFQARVLAWWVYFVYEVIQNLTRRWQHSERKKEQESKQENERQDRAIILLFKGLRVTISMR